MSPAPFLRPTTTQRLRAFLSAHDVRLPVLATADEARDALFAMMSDRAGNPAFWAELGVLAELIGEDARRGRVDGLAAPEAELLTDGQIAGLLRDLRRAAGEPVATVASNVASTFLNRTGATGTACVALLASALLVGCGRSKEATEPALAAASSSTASSQPLETPDASAPDALDALFRDGSPDDIAAELEAMVEAASDAASDAARDAGADASRKRSSTRPATTPREDRSWTTAVPMYKGVTV